MAWNILCGAQCLELRIDSCLWSAGITDVDYQARAGSFQLCPTPENCLSFCSPEKIITGAPCSSSLSYCYLYMSPSPSVWSRCLQSPASNHPHLLAQARALSLSLPQTTQDRFTHARSLYKFLPKFFLSGGAVLTGRALSFFCERGPGFYP